MLAMWRTVSVMGLLPWSACELPPRTMKAAVTSSPAQAENDFSHVQVELDYPVPQPAAGQVLIRVMASSVNPVDWKILRTPQLTVFGPKVLGFDVAGVIVQVGAGCSRLQVGDEVWADLGKGRLGTAVQLGAWAEYAVADESQVGLKPSSLDFASAGSLPLVALTDYQALKMAGAPWKDRQNFTVVITSGSGGTGLPAIQMAKAYGASRIVTAASASHTDLLKSAGATDVVDYHSQSLWDALPADSVDIVYDNFGAPGTADAAMPAMRDGGVFIFLPGKNGAVSKHPKAGVKQINFGLCDSARYEDLDALKQLADSGSLLAHVQESFTLDDVTKALSASFAGGVVGKIGIVAHTKVPDVVMPLNQCKHASYMYCCEYGTPCDCSKGTTSPGQCAEAAYLFCCSVGTPCDCSQPPSNGNSTSFIV